MDSTRTNRLGFMKSEKKMNMDSSRALGVFVLMGSLATRAMGKDTEEEDGKSIDPNISANAIRRTTII